MKEKNTNDLSTFKRIKSQRYSLNLSLSGVVIAFLLASFALGALGVWALVQLGFEDTERMLEIMLTILVFIVITTIVLFIFLVFLGRFPLKPVNDFINQMNRLSSGDFKARLHFGGFLSKNRTFQELEESFNELAEELDNTEMLRADFINNFSHEFKTPIVSIAGLAKLVNKGGLSEEEKKQYLLAIETESMRLANMATNVLNLTKVENQTILTDVKSYNISEQIRTCVLLLENQWSTKNIELSLDFDEYEIFANEELLKQVFINLLDNAIKFSPDGGVVSVEIHEAVNHLSVDIKNSGAEIPKDKIDKIFNKFYQADESHAAKGNGVGLAIVKKIVKLHAGRIAVTSEGGITTFTLTLPLHKKQVK
jgi:signal transduction histidine kinase